MEFYRIYGIMYSFRYLKIKKINYFDYEFISAKHLWILKVSELFSVFFKVVLVVFGSCQSLSK